MRRSHRRCLPFHTWLAFFLLIAADAAGRGLAAGPFMSAPVYDAGHSPVRMAACDLNGDGRADLAVANRGNFGEPVTVGLYLSEGGGLFRNAGVVYSTGPFNPLDFNRVPALACGDFNQDGRLDLLLENGSNSGNSFLAHVLLGQPDGTFTALQPDLTLPGPLTVGDSNADGRLDLLVRSPVFGGKSQLRVWIGAGNGTFSALPPFVNPGYVDFTRGPFSVADLNGDRIVDVVATSSPAGSLNFPEGSFFFKGNADGTFTFMQSYSGTPEYVFALGDVDRDGFADFIVNLRNSSNFELRAYRGHGDVTFDTAPFWSVTQGDDVFDVAIGDLQGDGFTDLVTLSYPAVGSDKSVRIWSGTGVSFTPSDRFPVGFSPTSVLLEEFDGAPGLDPAITADYSNTVTFMLARRDGSRLPIPLPDPYPVASVIDLVPADFNGDGRDDMAALQNPSTVCESCPWGAVEVRLAQPSGGFATIDVMAVGNYPQSLHAADLDLDGKLDLLAVNRVDDGSDTIIGPGSLSLLRGHGDGRFDPAVTVPTGQWPEWVAAGDLDHDGDVDLVEVNSYSSTVTVLLRNGAGVYAPQPPIAVGHAPIQVDLGEVDGDGAVDLLITSRGEQDLAIAGEVSWLRGHGNGTFDPRVVLATFKNATGLATGDFDSDGDVDLAVGDAGDPDGPSEPADPGGVFVLVHQAGAAFTVSPPIHVGLHPGRPRMGDFNGDGAPDLMVEASRSIAVVPGRGESLFDPAERFDGLGCFVFRPGRLVGDGDLDLFGSCSNLAVFENEADQSPDLRFLDNARLNWDPISLIGSFDVIQGSLPILRSTMGNFGTAVQACLQNNGAAHTLDSGAAPAVGSGFFYLVRAVRPNGTPGSYDGETPGQAAPRDASIQASAAACP